VEFLNEHLSSDRNAIALLDAAFSSGDEGDIMYALRAVTLARGGVADIAETAGLSRETLYRTLSRAGNPRLSTLLALMRAARVRIKGVASA
jgi:probable addiction module antidote protein